MSKERIKDEAADSRSGWVALQGHIVGSLQNWSTCWDWNGDFWTSRQDAIDAGFAAFDSDDFNVALIQHGAVRWFGWMDEAHELAQYADMAQTFGWTLAAAS